VSDYKPQDQPGVIKRLSFENIGGDDYSRYLRTQKGIVREIVTPKLSVPLSREGTRLNEYTDRNEIKAAVQARNELIRLIVFWYTVVKLRKALLSYIDNNTTVKELFQTKYLPEAAAVSPKVYTNG
jgi:hypothetical protein